MNLVTYDIEVIKKHVEKLGLDVKTSITMGDLSALRTSLRSEGHLRLSHEIEDMARPEVLEDFIVNTLYGDEP